MNLSQIRTMIGSIIDYDPQVQSYQDEVNRIINQVHLEFFTAHPWKFSQKSIDIYTRPDITDTLAQITGAGSADTLPNSLITFSSSTLLDTDNRQGQLRREGDVVQILGSAKEENNGLYILDKYNNSTSGFVSKYSEQNRVNWAGSVSNEVVTVKIQQRRLKMPYDCVNILSVGIRNLEEAGVGTNAVGHTYPISRREDEELNLRDDFTGTPTCWIPYDQPPDTVSRHVRDFIPRKGKDFHVTSVDASGLAWPAGTYEFKMAYELHGEIGPRSDAVSVVVAADEIPRFAFIDTTKLGFYGLRKHIYFRIVSAAGLDTVAFSEPYFRHLSGFLAYSASTFDTLIVEDTTTTFTPPYQDAWWSLDTVQGLMAVPRERQTNDNHWQIRLHPRPAAQTPMRIRYMFYPDELTDDFDTPQSPVDTHRYLVYRSCQELFIKHKNENQALYYEKKSEEELRKIEKRWLTERSMYNIKRSFRGGPTTLRPFRNLTHGIGADGL